MHFVCSTFGSAGDVFPMLGLAVELQRRGHDITFATNAHYGKIVESHNLKFEALGSEEDFRACVEHPDLWHPRRSFGHLIRHLSPFFKRQYQIYAERVQDPHSVGITNCFGFGALLAQDKLGIPVLTLHCQPAAIWSDQEPPSLPGLIGPRWCKRVMHRIGERFLIDPAVCPFLNQWRTELGLPPVQKITRWWNSRYGVLCLFPEWYAPPQRDWPQPLLQTSFPLWNDRSDQPLAPSVESFLQAGSQPVVFTPGSANIHGRSFFKSAVQACSELKLRAILLTEFPEQIPTDLPSTVRHFSYIPLDRLLPHAAAFVHHGGIGSTSQALLAGIPQVLMPLAHDQFDNAARVIRLGVGDSIPAPRFTAPKLGKALQSLLQSQSVIQQSREIAGRLTAKDGLQRSAEAVEQHVLRTEQLRRPRT